MSISKQSLFKQMHWRKHYFITQGPSAVQVNAIQIKELKGKKNYMFMKKTKLLTSSSLLMHKNFQLSYILSLKSNRVRNHDGKYDFSFQTVSPKNQVRFTWARRRNQSKLVSVMTKLCKYKTKTLAEVFQTKNWSTVSDWIEACVLIIFNFEFNHI